VHLVHQLLNIAILFILSWLPKPYNFGLSGWGWTPRDFWISTSVSVVVSVALPVKGWLVVTPLMLMPSLLWVPRVALLSSAPTFWFVIADASGFVRLIPSVIQLRREEMGASEDGAGCLVYILEVVGLSNWLVRMFGDESGGEEIAIFRVETVPERGIALLIGHPMQVSERSA
jgi:hypothetical protein